MHVRMLDNDNALQSEALNLGVNLIHVLFHHDQPEGWVEGLADGLSPERIEVDLIHFSALIGGSGEPPDEPAPDPQLARPRAVVFNPQGEVVVPGEPFTVPVMVSVAASSWSPWSPWT